jgi:hypothetical protein
LGIIKEESLRVAKSKVGGSRIEKWQRGERGLLVKVKPGG